MSPNRASAEPSALARRICSLSDIAHARVIVGIVGAPGGGKSTLAAAVVAMLGAAAVHVPMDGYHLAQTVLDQAGLTDVKGAPQTFDAAGYVSLLQRIRAHPKTESVFAPQFRREIEEPIAGAIEVKPHHQYVVTEGNYLLLDQHPWDRIPALLDEAWFLLTPEDVRLDRLVARHLRYGRPEDQSWERATTGTDGVNGRLVLATQQRADLLLHE
ncbi:nucleoside/nucleotide kinase family protein [Nakamurella antarctica]|uniref:Nucleoside/nucleotide kinase family protein n=1 Tax=Nakamurella antarctica TaxID=1902245 RepID=A0A3G8ZLD4_9ACTN|nr:nucleoside/nucleotide kinase family protein [Nakamurella antarctica]AZI57645.1 nucleoside/nucleotide kinase family protein [Nakamurella antarctica]